uniref:Uncharacterized protein n=1 Tax=Rhizophora mucronata TaxID=61149 RepID=A0A2P2PE21_RHIMU
MTQVFYPQSTIGSLLPHSQNIIARHNSN